MHCSICYESLYVSDYIRNDIKIKTNALTLSCNHIFHNHCIRRLLIIYQDDKCPICRRIYLYKIKPSRHLHKKLRKQIIKKLENECGRIHESKITDLFLFLDKKNINIPFVTRMFDISEDNYILENDCKWMEYVDGTVTIYENECCHSEGNAIMFPYYLY